MSPNATADLTRKERLNSAANRKTVYLIDKSKKPMGRSRPETANLKDLLSSDEGRSTGAPRSASYQRVENRTVLQNEVVCMQQNLFTQQEDRQRLEGPWVLLTQEVIPPPKIATFTISRA